LRELEQATDGERDAALEAEDTDDSAVQDVIDQWLVVARQADEDEVAQAVSQVERDGGRVAGGGDRRSPESTIDGTLDDDRGR